MSAQQPEHSKYDSARQLFFLTKRLSKERAMLKAESFRVRCEIDVKDY